LVGSIIAGATSPQQVRENAEATVSDLTPEEVSEVGALVG
jgi:aryl-alcohol dehydrogenase-like predicted oxidoreductase